MHFLPNSSLRYSIYAQRLLFLHISLKNDHLSDHTKSPVHLQQTQIKINILCTDCLQVQAHCVILETYGN